MSIKLNVIFIHQLELNLQIQKNWKLSKTNKNPFVIYTDFESTLEKIPIYVRTKSK